MQLSENRDLFIQITGLRKLVNGNGSNKGGAVAWAGANMYMNFGSRWLDDMYDTPKSEAWYMKDTVANQYILKPKNLRTVDEVHIQNSEGKADITSYKKDEGWLRNNYDFSGGTPGTPTYWSVVTLGLSPEQSSLTDVGGASPYTAEFTYGAENLMFGNHFKYSGIMWAPMCDGVYTMAIKGKFYSGELAADTDVNYWTEANPESLAMAAAYVRELFMRNTQGANDWLVGINLRMDGIDKSMASHESAGFNQIQG